MVLYLAQALAFAFALLDKTLHLGGLFATMKMISKTRILTRGITRLFNEMGLQFLDAGPIGSSERALEISFIRISIGMKARSQRA